MVLGRLTFLFVPFIPSTSKKRFFRIMCVNMIIIYKKKLIN